MRKFASIPPRIWQADLKAVRGNMEALTVHYHLTTNNHANMLGLYFLPIAYIAHETGCPLEGASKGLLSLIEAKICTYDFERELVWVHEMASDQVAPHLSPKDKRVKGIADQLAMLPICPITQAFYARYRIPYHLHDERILEDFEVSFDGQAPSPMEAPSEPLRSKEKEQEKKKDLETGEGPFCSGTEKNSKSSSESMFTPYRIPSSAAEARTFLASEGTPPSKMDECIRLMMGGNLSRYELEGIIEAERSAA